MLCHIFQFFLFFPRWFTTDNSVSQDKTPVYATDVTVFTGRLMTELASQDRAIPPNHSVTIVLTPADSQFVLMRGYAPKDSHGAPLADPNVDAEGNPVKFITYICGINLHYPIGHMSASYRDEFEREFKKRPIVLDYRTFVFQYINVNRARHFETTNLECGRNPAVKKKEHGRR